MKQIFNRGNLPSHVAVFAVQLQGVMNGQKETEFWEASNINEFEKNASKIGYEIVPTMDMTTKRCYLVGFDAEDSVMVTHTGLHYSQLKMYFVEVSEGDFKLWVAKIKDHREAQQQDMFSRREESSRKKKLAINKLSKKGEKK